MFGRFDPADTDRRVGATRRTTHAFYRTRRGQWMVTSLAARDWDPVQSSSVPMDRLRFGDFTGDGVTDVLAVSNGRWSISQSARGSWRRLNRHLDDPVRNLFIANMDADDNIDDILRLDIEHTNSRWTSAARTRMTWYRSKNGREPWTRWKEYDFGYDRSWETVVPRYGFVGRFGLTPRGGTLVIDPLRYGNFHSDAARVVGASLSWKSAFPY